MKRAIQTLILAVIITFVYADNESVKSSDSSEAPVKTVTLTGCVIDFDSGEALAGVEIKIDDTNIRTYTDFDGNFEFTGVKPGKHNLVASYISYNNSLVENFEAGEKSEQVNIRMQPSNYLKTSLSE